ncbi:MAG: hypothetical protein Q8T08_07875 [Ignavibacteria bacterium]|nr:hypothetical protein [Ignavibacteria bacterium]
MDKYRFHLCFSAYSLNTANFVFTGSVFQQEPDQVMVVANMEKDNCTIDKIEFTGKSDFKVFVKDIDRVDIMQKVKFRFHILFSTNDGKVFKQTLNCDKKSELSYPKEIEIRDN